jgi:phosphohistidine swiveling domain-containing protein
MRCTRIFKDRSYTPYLMLMVLEATVFRLKKIYPKSKIKSGYTYWKNGRNTYFYPTKELSATVRDLTAEALKNPQFLYRIFKTALQKSKKLNEFSQNFKKLKLKNESSEKLLKILDIFTKKFIDMYAYGTASVLIGYYQDGFIYKKSSEILKKKTRKNPEKFAEYLIALTRSPKKYKTHALDLEIFVISRLAKKHNLSGAKQVEKKFKKEFLKLYDKYKWLAYDFNHKFNWGIDHFTKLVVENMKTDIQKKEKELRNYEDITKKEINRLSNELGLAREERKIFEIIRNLEYYKWEREYEFQEALFNAKFIQDELGKRSGLPGIESKYLMNGELGMALENSFKYKKIAARRMKNFLLTVDATKGRVFLVGKMAKENYDRFIFEEENVVKKTGTIKGTPASPGVATGTVKIVNSVKDLAKIKKGDILVSHATGPELLPGMQKSGAIITDEGGVACHAAITARELRIPCVVGTKIATQVLKDNDLVEVNADRGIVKILK